MDDLQSMREDFAASFQTAPDAIFSNWDRLARDQNQQGQKFLKRIEDKIDELKSLREEVGPNYFSRVFLLTPIEQRYITAS
jgi:hypothetical protein